MMKTTLKDILSIMKVQFSECKETFFFQLVYGFCLSFQNMPTVVFPAMIINELTGSRNSGILILYIVLFAGSVFFIRYISAFIEGLQSIYNLKLPHTLILKLAKKMFIIDYSETEKAEFIDQYDNAGNEVFNACGNIYTLFTLGVSVVVKFILLIYIISTLDISLVFILLLFSVLNCILNTKENKTDAEYQSLLSSAERRGSYAWDLTSSLAFAKDLRMYAPDDYVESHYLECEKIRIQIEKEKKRKIFIIRTLQVVLSILQMAIMYTFMIVKFNFGLITIGGFALYISTANEFYGTIASFLRIFEKTKSVSYHYKAFRNFMELPEIETHGYKVDKVNAPCIEFRNVSFRYPGRDDYALRNINLKVCPFEHLAIVGDNGAGKTTFIKLLTRLYEPTEGAILIDGRNIKEYDYEQYMSLFSPVFQDFELLAYSIKENITFDNYDKNRFEKVTQCVGLQETIEKLANHENTFIKKEFESSGVELSGGEKQKVAIARAFYKDAVIALLDEPTAAIDPMAEYEVFRKFFEFSKQKTTFLISHRMGSTRFCDRIIVFENGEIVEVGTHKELIERDGVYNRMYQKQASYYVGN